MRRDRLQVRAHYDLADAPTVCAGGHDVLEEADACAPDVAIAAVHLLEAPAHGLLRREAIEQRVVRLRFADWLKGLIIGRACEGELARDEMLTGCEERGRRRGTARRIEEVGGVDQ